MPAACPRPVARPRVAGRADRGLRAAVLAGVVLAAVVLTGCSLPAAPPTRQADPRPERVVTGAGVPVPAHAQEAVVVSITDGDTLRLRGRGAGPLPGDVTKVRVLLIDTPEVRDVPQCFGPEASARLEQLVPPGSTVRVEADRDPEDRFGRALLHLWAPDGRNVGETLVAEGYATVLQLDPNRRYLEQFEARERAARADGRGLWSAC